MYQVGPSNANWRDAVVYLNFEGASDLTYFGPETIEAIEVPPYEIPAYLDLKRQDVRSIWSGEKINEARALHIKGRRRDIDICSHCHACVKPKAGIMEQVLHPLSPDTVG